MLFPRNPGLLSVDGSIQDSHSAVSESANDSEQTLIISRTTIFVQYWNPVEHIYTLRWGQIWPDFTGLDLQKRGHKSGGGAGGGGRGG
jgi:hypothetical protein